MYPNPTVSQSNPNPSMNARTHMQACDRHEGIFDVRTAAVFVTISIQATSCSSLLDSLTAAAASCMSLRAARLLTKSNANFSIV